MIKRLTIGDIRITFTIAHIVKVGGFNSLLIDGNHILMWDFDDTTLKDVVSALARVQGNWRLPKISVLETTKDTNYIAYCFKRCSWLGAIQVVANTEGVDYNFFKYGVLRSKFTLRVTDKGYGKPHCVAVLESKIPEDAVIEDFATWVNYETLKK